MRLAALVGLLSLALDLAMGQPMEHAVRTCLLAVSLGESLGLDDDTLADVYYVALLRSVGCTADPHALVHFFGDDTEAQAALALLDPAHPLDAIRFVIRRAGQDQSPLRRAGAIVDAALQFCGQAEAAAVAHCAAIGRHRDRHTPGRPAPLRA